MATDLKKEMLIAEVKYLNRIIRYTKKENAYDMALEFFQTTSYLYDRIEEVGKLPLKGWCFLGIKSEKRRFAEQRRKRFISEIKSAGRDLNGHNRTKSGVYVTKKDIFFGDVCGLHTNTLARFEAAKNDVYVQDAIRLQIVDFIKSYVNSFNIAWLR